MITEMIQHVWPEGIFIQWDIWPVECVLASSVETELCSTQSTPCNAVTSVVQASKGTLTQQTETDEQLTLRVPKRLNCKTLYNNKDSMWHEFIMNATKQRWTNARSCFYCTYPEARGIGQQVLLRDLHVIHEDHPCGRGSQGEFSLNLRCRETLHATLQDKAADLPIITFGPNYSNIGHWGVGDPDGENKGSVWPTADEGLLSVLHVLFISSQCSKEF